MHLKNIKRDKGGVAVWVIALIAIGVVLGSVCIGYVVDTQYKGETYFPGTNGTNVDGRIHVQVVVIKTPTGAYAMQILPSYNTDVEKTPGFIDWVTQKLPSLSMPAAPPNAEVTYYISTTDYFNGGSGTQGISGAINGGSMNWTTLAVAQGVVPAGSTIGVAEFDIFISDPTETYEIQAQYHLGTTTPTTLSIDFIPTHPPGGI